MKAREVSFVQYTLFTNISYYHLSGSLIE